MQPNPTVVDAFQKLQELQRGQIYFIRVRAAREAGIKVEARERGYNDVVTEPEQQRFAVKGKKPDTWGQAIELRVGKQSPKRFGKETPYGSHELPKLSGKE